jgi:hypothetical protein
MRNLLPVIVLLAQASTHAADTLPRQLAGTWGTGQTLYEGTAEQMFAYLATDGAAAVIGSGRAPATVPTDGGVPPPARPVMGFPAVATLDGDTLTLRPFMPGAPAPVPDSAVLRCRHDSAAVTLTCSGPDGVRHVLRYRGEAIAPEAAQAMEAVRKH